MRRLLVAAAIASGVFVIGPGHARAQFSGERFSSTKWHVRLVAPRKWKVSRQRSYPNILLWMSRQKPSGRMLFAAENINWDTTALQYAKQTEARLRKLGFEVKAPQEHSSGAYWIEFNNGKLHLQQAFLVNGNIGYTLTMSAKTERILRQLGLAYDATLRSIRRERVTRPLTVRPKVKNLRDRLIHTSPTDTPEPVPAPKPKPEPKKAK